MRRVVLIAASALLLSGCFSSEVGFSYLPERTYYEMFRDIRGAQFRHIEHVETGKWGMHFFGLTLRSVSVRELVAPYIEGKPNYYVANLNIHTDMHRTFTPIQLLMLYFPKVSLEFDVIEVTAPSYGGGS